MVFFSSDPRLFGVSFCVTVRDAGRTSFRTVGVIGCSDRLTFGVFVCSTRSYCRRCCAFFPVDYRCAWGLLGVTVSGIGPSLLV